MDVWLFGTISYLRIWNHQIETTIYKWMAVRFQVCALFVKRGPLGRMNKMTAVPM